MVRTGNRSSHNSRRSRPRHIAAFIAAIVLMQWGGSFVGLPAEARAQSVSIWNGTAGNWSDFTKWSTNPLYPNNGNGGFTYNASISSGTVTLDSSVTLNRFTLSGGS